MKRHSIWMIVILLAAVMVLSHPWSYAHKTLAFPSVPTANAKSLPLAAVKATPQVSLRVPILMYHHVGPLPERADGTRRDLTVSVDTFAAQVEWLHKNNYESVTLKQAYLASQGQFILPKHPIVFTFDDGYKDVFDNAIPILKHYGYTGSFGIITSFVAHQDYADWGTIRQADNSGMEIVSHTYNHFDGSSHKFNADYIRRDLQASLDDINHQLGHSTDILIYPYGHYTAEYITIAEQVGFKLATTTKYGTTVKSGALMEVPRIRVHGKEVMENFIKNLGIF